MSESEEDTKKKIEADLEKLSSTLEDLMRSLEATEPAQKKLDRKEEIKQDLRGRFDSLSHKMNAGFRVMMQALLDMGQFLTQEEIKAYTHSFSEISMIHEIIDKHWQAVLQQMARGEEITTALGIGPSGLKGMYDLASKLLEYQHYEEAVSCFCLLSLLEPEQQIFWFGLGHSEYCLGHFTDALIAYTMASEVAPNDPDPHLFMAHCYRGMKEYEAIRSCFLLAEQAAHEEKRRNQVKASIQQLKEAWKL